MAYPELVLQVGVYDTMNDPQIKIGIDVSKASLELSSFDKGKDSVANTPAGIRSLLRRIQKLPQLPVLCCEATGGYEKLVVNLCHEVEVPIAVVNARQVRDFAKSKGILAKTDLIDANVLSMFAEQNTLRLKTKTEPWRQSLQALLTRREDLKDLITQERNRLETLQDPFVRKQIEANLRMFKKQNQHILKTIEALVSSTETLQKLCSRMMQVKGIGLLVATSLIAFLPEIGQISDKQVAALAGLAPYNQDSGTWKGQRHVSGGRSKVRTALYMPAICAAHNNPVLKEFYDGMILRGKPAKVALTAVMRKMVCLANRIASDPEFIPS